MPPKRLKKERLERFVLGKAALAKTLGYHPLLQIVPPLKVPPLADGELSREPKRHRDTLGDLEVPPSAASPALHVHGA